MNFLFTKHRKNRQDSSKHSVSVIPSPRKNIYGITSILSNQNISFGWLPYPLKPSEHINISQPLFLFLFFEEPSVITEVIEEIFEVKTSEDIEDMVYCNINQDTPPTPAPTK